MIQSKKGNVKVHFPIEIERKKYCGNLYGFYHSESKQYNVLSYGSDKNLDYQLLGEIGEKIQIDTEHKESLLSGYWDSEKLIFTHEGKRCEKLPYDLHANIFSRNTGILETDLMLDKAAVISGCGSVGSLVSLELARAGLGSFLLLDNDTVDYHNICRHQCGITDVGKFKVSAVKERILQINPKANVQTYSDIIERVPKETFDNFFLKNGLIIGCADNREGDLYADSLSKLYNVPFVSIGFWERAFAGEIFYSIPGETAGYDRIFNGQLSGRTSTNRRLYTFEEDIKNTNFEPGISVDISFVTLIAIKLIIDLFNKNNGNYIPRVLNNLSQFTLVCNTNDKRIGGDQAEIFSYPLQVTTSITIS